MNFYLDVLIESAWRASFIPLPSEATLAAMQAFGGYNIPLAVAMAVVGGVAIQMLNWWIGTLLFKLRNHTGGWNIPDTTLAKAQHIFTKYAVFLLLFAWATFGNVLVVIAGFLGAKPKMVLPLLVVGYAAHYGMYLL